MRQGDLIGGIEQTELEVLLARAGAAAARQLGLIFGKKGLELGLAGQQGALQLLQPLSQQRGFVLAVEKLSGDALGLSWGAQWRGQGVNLLPERGKKRDRTSYLYMFIPRRHVSVKGVN